MSEPGAKRKREILVLNIPYQWDGFGNTNYKINSITTWFLSQHELATHTPKNSFLSWSFSKQPNGNYQIKEVGEKPKKIIKK